MGTWDDYKHEEHASALEPGDYRVEIVSAEERTSKSGNPMIVVGIRPNGSKVIINEYFVKGEYFNRKISGFFDGFPEIDDGDFNFVTWIGCIGAVRLKQDGEYLRVHYFLTPKQAKDLPAWVGPQPERQKVTDLYKEAETAPDSQFPF